MWKLFLVLDMKYCGSVCTLSIYLNKFNLDNTGNKIFFEIFSIKNNYRTMCELDVKKNDLQMWKVWLTL